MSTATCEPLVQEHDAAGHTGSMQLVSFKLAEETYGIEITKIREIILVGEITHIPETPPYVKGLINLRSTVIPVIDLRIRFSLADAELTPDSRIMVLHVGSRMIGIVVDSVNEVLRVTEQSAAGSEEMASSSEQLGAQAQALRDLVGQFTTGSGQSGKHQMAMAGFNK
jgi:purine-binding chemotaxis protein CheW